MSSTNSNKDLSEKTFEQKWVIRNWVDVVHSDTNVVNTTTEITCNEENLEYANFLLGFTITPNDRLRLYLKLLWKHFCLQIVEAILIAEILKRDGLTVWTIKSETNAVVGRTIETETDTFPFPYKWKNSDVAYWLNSEGSLVINVKITLTKLQDVLRYSKSEQFLNSCRDEFSQNVAALLEDTLSSDVKILTKDKIELHAHKAILRARCPVFASMFGSDFLESSTGLINVDDISAKTMKILLKFWYSGELEDSWKDNDTVVEFTYSAGKYQMTKILKMLDDVLGLNFKATDRDVELLKMVQNLSLQDAEARMLKHVIYKISKSTSGVELLNLFSLEIGGLDNENFAALQILKEFDDILSEQTDKDTSPRHVELLVFACKLGIRNVEQKLLQRIIATAEMVTSANDLFALFDIQTEANTDDSKGRDLLVRANTK